MTWISLLCYGVVLWLFYFKTFWPSYNHLDLCSYGQLLFLFSLFFLGVVSVVEKIIIRKYLRGFSSKLICIFDSVLVWRTRKTSFEYKATFRICVLALWVHKGYCVVKKLVWNEIFVLKLPGILRQLCKNGNVTKFVSYEILWNKELMYFSWNMT